MKTYSIGQSTKEVGVTGQTLRNWKKTKEMIRELSKDDSYDQN